MYVCGLTCTCVSLLVRARGQCWCLPQLISILFFEVESLTEPGTLWPRRCSDLTMKVPSWVPAFEHCRQQVALSVTFRNPWGGRALLEEVCPWGTGLEASSSLCFLIHLAMGNLPPTYFLYQDRLSSLKPGKINRPLSCFFHVFYHSSKKVINSEKVFLRAYFPWSLSESRILMPSGHLPVYLLSAESSSEALFNAL